jgi:hypothetical protein
MGKKLIEMNDVQITAHWKYSCTRNWKATP